MTEPQEPSATPEPEMVCPCCNSDGLTGWTNVKTNACGILCLHCGCEFDQKVVAVEPSATPSTLELAMDALGSISRNSCCGGCQEAKLVALAALSKIAALRPSEGPETGRPPEAVKALKLRWNNFLENGGFFNPGMTASVNEDAMRQLALDTRDFLAGLVHQAAPAASEGQKP